MLPIKGIQKTTLVDYPGKVASTIFIAGCNFRCPFCHNKVLVTGIEGIKTISEDEILDYLASRRKYIDGICITGGEPTLYQELPLFLKKLKVLGYSIKLDTNGTNPALMQEMINAQLIDYIAMDIKSSKEMYSQATAVPALDLTLIQKSIDLIKISGVKYEFRTTVLPRFYKEEDIDRIGIWLQGAKKYCLQQFEMQGGTLDESIQKDPVYLKSELETMAKRLEKYIETVEVRGNL